MRCCFIPDKAKLEATVILTVLAFAILAILKYLSVVLINYGSWTPGGPGTQFENYCLRGIAAYLLFPISESEKPYYSKREIKLS